jgi:hypothetical protein
VFAAATLVVAALIPAPLASAATHASGWLRPVDGAVIRPFAAPASVYGPGHRGVDFAAAPGTPVLAANDGTVVFAGSVAGSLHVTLSHDGGLRTSYSFLQSVAVRQGARIERGDAIGTTGGSAADHDGTVVHVGLRVGDEYVDPMVLFGPTDLTKLVHLVPVDGSREQSWTRGDERRELRVALHLPLPSGLPAAPSSSDHGCGDGIPVVGALVDAACNVGEWIGDRAAEAVDIGLRYLDAVTGAGDAVLAAIREPLARTADELRLLPTRLASALARTPEGMLVLDVVAIGRRFADAAFAECANDAPDADGTGGSAHRVMVVAGINSQGRAGDRGPTSRLDVDALGYHRAEGEVRYFSYAPDSGAYGPDDTHGDLRAAAARLADQLRAMQREQPGREVDLIAHSQGGVVVDLFLGEYRASDPSLPPIGNVITLSSPHEGAPLATTAEQLRSSRVGKELIDTVSDVFTKVPPGNSTAVRQLSERSTIIADIQRRGVPEHIDFTSIGATEDYVVPATNISLEGAAETTVAVNDVRSEHKAIVEDPNALRAVRAALEGRAPPCVDLLTALRGAVVPVVVARASHLVGEPPGPTLPDAP